MTLFALAAMGAKCEAQLQPNEGSWGQAFVWFPWTTDCPLKTPSNNCAHCEIAHAVLIGKPGVHRGKILFWRTTEGGGRWLFDPATMTHGSAGGPPGPLDVFCCGQSVDPNGDIIMVGGDRTGGTCRLPGQGHCCQAGCRNPGYWTEPNWTHIYDPSPVPNNPHWFRPPGLPPHGSDLMTSAPPGTNPGHYYSATVVLADGRVMQVGGGTAPFTPPDSSCCWMGTATQSPVVADANWCQVFDPFTLRWQGIDAGNPFADAPVAGLQVAPLPNGDLITGFHFYPLAHLLSTNQVFASVVVGGARTPAPTRTFSPSALLDVRSWPPPPPGWTVLNARFRSSDSASAPVLNLLYPTAVMLPWRSSNLIGDDRVWVIGGSDTNEFYTTTGPHPRGRPVAGQVWEIHQPQRTTAPLPEWRIIGNLAYPRVYSNAIVLPTMQVIVLGGSGNYFAPYGGVGTASSDPEVLAQPVLHPEIVDLEGPGAGVWRTLTPHESARTYHNVAVLLPDGRIFHAGGYKGDSDIRQPLGPNHRCNVSDNTYSDVEIYTPPYLSPGARRPVIQQAPAIANYNSSITVTVTLEDDDIPLDPATEIEYGFLVRCAAVMHHFDWDQKSMKLDVLSRTATTVTFAPLPSLANNGSAILPPGYYMLFVVRRPNATVGWRVPSVAKFVQVI